MIMPGSHRTFVGCVGRDPEGQLQAVPPDAGRRHPLPTRRSPSWPDRHGIKLFTGAAGSATWFDCNCMHGSGDNITPFPRSNVFIVFNSVDNPAVDPFAAPAPRPDFIGARGPFEPLTSAQE